MNEFQNNSILWVGMINGEYATRIWTRFGSEFQNWYLELNDQDFVLFAAGTVPEWRGNMLSPMLCKYIFSQEEYNIGDAYIDVKIWNKPAINAWQKIGVKLLATVKPDLHKR